MVLFKRVSDYVMQIPRLLFFFSLIFGIGIDAYYKFDIPDIDSIFIPVLIGYTYLCAYIAFYLTKAIIRISKSLYKIFIYLGLWLFPIYIIINSPTIGILQSLAVVIVFTSFFTVLFMSLLYLFSIRKLLLRILVGVTFLTVLVWIVSNKIFPAFPSDTSKSKTNSSGAELTVSPGQLNSRYKITKVIKNLKVDLNKDGKDELVVVSLNDKFKNAVFFYAGFYRYNPAIEIWDEIYSDELNILNIAGLVEKSPDNYSEMRQKLIKVWSEEFTKVTNLGDLTGDDCPEILFSSLIQGKYLDNNLIVAQAGTSNIRFKIFSDFNSQAEIISEDGLMIEKYANKDLLVKDIYQWDKNVSKFILRESQKIPLPTGTPSPQTIPGLEEISS